MNLELRDMTLSDLDQVMPLVSALQCDPSQREALRAMLSEIIESACGVATVAADSKPSCAIVHFGVNVFVSERRADEYHRCAYPMIARRMLAEWIAGEHPFLHAEEIGRANAGEGLNLVVPYYGGRRDDPRASIANYESARRALRGWNLRSYTAEMFSDPQHDDRQWGRSLGYRVLEYSPDALRAAGVPDERPAFVWATTRRDAELNPGYGAALLFTFTAPRLGFTPLEQHLLHLALDGATDPSIARVSGLSQSAVKKHFRVLYEKARVAGVLESAADDSGPEQPTRGVEHRRHLLSYLREHPEELRPYRPARGSRVLAGER